MASRVSIQAQRVSSLAQLDIECCCAVFNFARWETCAFKSRFHWSSLRALDSPTRKVHRACAFRNSQLLVHAAPTCSVFRSVCISLSSVTLFGRLNCTGALSSPVERWKYGECFGYRKSIGFIFVCNV